MEFGGGFGSYKGQGSLCASHQPLPPKSALDLGEGWEGGQPSIAAPSVLTGQYYAVLEAPHKEIVWFEHSGHNPWVSESSRFVEAMVKTVLAQAQQTRISE